MEGDPSKVRPDQEPKVDDMGRARVGLDGKPLNDQAAQPSEAKQISPIELSQKANDAPPSSFSDRNTALLSYKQSTESQGYGQALKFQDSSGKQYSGYLSSHEGQTTAFIADKSGTFSSYNVEYKDGKISSLNKVENGNVVESIAPRNTNLTAPPGGSESLTERARPVPVDRGGSERGGLVNTSSTVTPVLENRPAVAKPDAPVQGERPAALNTIAMKDASVANAAHNDAAATQVTAEAPHNQHATADATPGGIAPRVPRADGTPGDGNPRPHDGRPHDGIPRNNDGNQIQPNQARPDLASKPITANDFSVPQGERPYNPHPGRPDASNDAGRGPGTLRGEVAYNADGSPKNPGSSVRPEGRGDHSDGGPHQPRDGGKDAGILDAAGRNPAGKQDFIQGEMRDKAAAVRTEAASMQVDGKLIAQLQGMGRSPEMRQQFADLIAKFQEGKQLAGKDAALADLFKGLKPEQLSALKSWSQDGGRFPLDVKSLDIKTQQRLSNAFELLQTSDRVSGRVLDLLGEKGRYVDKIPTGEQSKFILQDLLKGLKETQLAGGREPGRELMSILNRSLGEKGAAEFRLSPKELGTLGAELALRMQNKDFLSTLSERGLTARLDGRPGEQLGMNLNKDAGMLKENVATKDGVQLSQAKDGANREAGKELGGRELIQQLTEGKGRFSEVVKDALSRGEITRALTERPADRNEPALNVRQNVVETTVKAELQSSNQSDLKAPDGKPIAQSLEEEGRRKKEDELRLQQEQLLTQQLKEKQDREQKEKDERLEEEKEKDRLRKLEEEEKKRKEEESKKYQDAEFSYTVSEGDTLDSIAGKFSGRTAQIIYARNESSGQIMLHDYQGKKYAKLFPGQKITIPNQKFIDEFKRSTRSYGHINFGKIPYGSAEDELKAWEAGMTAMRKFIGNDREAKDEGPVKTRSFSSKSASDDERKANVRAAMGGAASEKASMHAVKLGEGLRSIAQKLYNKPSHWRLLAYVNDLPLDTDAKGNPLAQLKRGDQIQLPNAQTIAAYEKNPDGFLRGENIELDPIAKMEAVDLQDVSLELNDEPAMNFSPDEQAPQGSEPVPAAYGEKIESVSHQQNLLPKADLAEVKIGFEESDPIWTPKEEPEKLDDIAYIVESEMLDGDTRGLCLSLQIYAGGEWVGVSEYQIFPDVSYRVRLNRAGDRSRSPSTIPPKKAMEMARNDFRKNWQTLFRGFWNT